MEKCQSCRWYNYEEKSTISCKKKVIFSGIYYQEGKYNSSNIVTSIILVCQ